MANNSGYESVISSRAQKEIIQGWQWYEERQQQLGDRFLNEVMHQIQLIEQNPGRYPTRYKSYKEALVLDFPFLIIYRLNSKRKSIRIVSVFHTSRNPGGKYK